MLSGFGPEAMLDLIRRAALPIEARAAGEAILGAETVSRRLAAIICCRCCRLFAAHGSGRRRSARPSQKPAPRSDRFELDKGRTLETTGDGMLIEFANAVQAARIAAG
jgi:hypothetical protein